MNWLLVFIGGGLGTLARYGSGLAIRHYFESTFPVATLAANVLSCAILGVFLRFSPEINTENWKLFFITGICGGFSTFSSFSWENVELVRQGAWMYVGINVLLSIVACFLIIYFLSKNTAA